MTNRDAGPDTRESERLQQVARELSPFGVHGAGRWYEPYPLFFARAQGARLWNADGNAYIGLHGGLGPCVLGTTIPRFCRPRSTR
jgi:glutamate-1-semialdehyde 2,1-aminomutase